MRSITWRTVSSPSNRRSATLSIRRQSSTYTPGQRPSAPGRVALWPISRDGASLILEGLVSPPPPRFAAVDVEEELGNEMAVGRGKAHLGANAMVCVLPALDVLVVIDKS